MHGMINWFASGFYCLRWPFCHVAAVTAGSLSVDRN